MRALLALLICLAVPAAAQTSLQPLNQAREAAPWAAVGQLKIANGASYCSATLIGARLVLTAAHCLYSPATGTPVAPAEIEFLPGWRFGRAESYRVARRYILHPDYIHEGEDWAVRLSHDIALIELDVPVSESTVTPLDWAAVMPARGPVSVVSYALGRQEAPSLESDCAVVAREGTAMLLSCSAGPGASGAPVLAELSGQMRVVAMISAIAQWGGDQVSAGVEVGPAIDLLLPLLNTAPGGIRLRSANGGSIAEQLGRSGN